MAYSRRSYKGAAVSNALGGSGLAANATSITLTAAMSGWSTSGTPFFVVVDPGTAKEEKLCVIYASSTTLTVVDPAVTSAWSASVNGRGVDDTTDRAHDVGATIYPVFTATEANQANELVSRYTTNGDIVVHGTTGPKTISTGGSGNNNKVLVADSTVADGGVKWAQINADGIATDAVTADKILANAVGSSEIASGAVGVDELATAVINRLVPVGTIAAYAGATAPTGWLLCDGTSTTGYTALATLVGSTTPDFRGHTLVGKGSAPFDGALLSKFGSTTSTAAHTHTIDHDHANTNTGGMTANATLNHTVNDPGHEHTLDISTTSGGINGALFLDGGTVQTGYVNNAGTGISVNSHDVSHVHSVDTPAHSGNSGASSVGATHGNVQPSALVNYIIKHD
jgi:microcystin-dependent protein